MKIFKVDFKPIWPVGCCLIIAAEDLKQAQVIAGNTIKHTDKFIVKQVDISNPTVIIYDSGDY